MSTTTTKPKSPHSTDGAVTISHGYKQTEVGAIPGDWDLVKLGAVTTEIGDGLHATPVYSQHGEYFFINGNNIHEGRIVITEDTKAVEFSEFKKYKKNLGDKTVLLSINGTIGNLALFAGEAVVLGKSAAYLNVKDDVETRYFYYSLQTESVARQFNDGLTGTTIRNLGLTTIRSTQIPLPPTKVEQRAIAEVLSDVDGLIGALDKLIAKKRAIKQATMQQLLTGKTRLPGFSRVWTRHTLADLGAFSKGRGIKRNDVSDDGVPCIRYGELYTTYHNYVLSPVSRIPADIASTALPIKTGDLLFAGSGETSEEIGKCAAYLGIEEAYAGGDIVVLRPAGQNSLYLGYLMNHETVVRQKAQMGQGDAVVHISARNLAEIAIDLPPLEEQNAIATVLSDMDAEIAALERRRNKTQQIKQGMMQQLLNGRIRLVRPCTKEESTA